MSTTTTTLDAGSYTTTAKILHWVVAVLVVGSITVGISLGYMADGPQKDQLYDVHKSTGVLILGLMLLRIVWRLTHRPPSLPSSLPKWQVGASHAVHWTLYAILLIQPILGWVGSNAYGAPVPFFGMFELPRIASENKPFAEQVLAVHAAFGISAAVLIAVHVTAALYHGLSRQDGVLQRMT